jgi:transposase-like protein
MIPETTENLDLVSLIEQFGSEDRCREFLEELRWPDGVECERCATAGRRARRVSRIIKRHQFHCDECSYQFSVRAGTIFHDSKLPLWKWFLAVFLMCESRKGISANQLKRMLKVSYKTAWFLCHRIRAAMHDETSAPLSGVVEMDETFLGGKQHHGRGPHGKVVVLGAAQRGGEIRLKLVPNRGALAIDRFLKENVSPDAEAFYTDALPVYPFAARAHGVPHDSVNRSNDEWVHGQVHTNTIEGVWSLLDRSIIGAYHKISKKHLPRYLDELEWRFNNRKNAYLFRDTVLELIETKRLEYRDLVA